jgi:hypothetical protein
VSDWLARDLARAEPQGGVCGGRALLGVLPLPAARVELAASGGATRLTVADARRRGPRRRRLRGRGAGAARHVGHHGRQPDRAARLCPQRRRAGRQRDPGPAGRLRPGRHRGRAARRPRGARGETVLWALPAAAVGGAGRRPGRAVWTLEATVGPGAPPPTAAGGLLFPEVSPRRRGPTAPTARSPR